MRLERAQLGRITCSPLWKLPRAGRGSGIVIDLMCSPGRGAACAWRCGAGWGRGWGERLGSGSWRQAGCRAKAIRAAAGAPGSAGLAAAHGKARGGTDAPSAAPRFHCPGGSLRAEGLRIWGVRKECTIRRKRRSHQAKPPYVKKSRPERGRFSGRSHTQGESNRGWAATFVPPALPLGRRGRGPRFFHPESA